ncbi:MAG: hypothetical protein ABW123_15515 [Cystobacter sp.]
MRHPKQHGLTDNPSQCLWGVRHAFAQKDEALTLEGKSVLEDE